MPIATTQLGAMSTGLPDVCKTPIGPVVTPLPYPNIAESSSHVPNVVNQFYAAGTVHNLMTEGTLSNGDQAGVEMGVVSEMIMGPDKYMLGSLKVINETAPGARQTTITAQNGEIPNAPGSTLMPSENRVQLMG